MNCFLLITSEFKLHRSCRDAAEKGMLSRRCDLNLQSRFTPSKLARPPAVSYHGLSFLPWRSVSGS